MSADVTAGSALRRNGGPSSGASAVEELTALNDTALALIQHLDLESVLQAIVERAGRLVGTEHGYLYLREPDDSRLTVHIATGLIEHQRGYTVLRGEGVAGRVWETGQPVVIDDYSGWAGRSRRLDGKISLRAVVGVPLRTASGVEGVLGLLYEEPGRRFDAAAVALLVRFGRLASLALEKARLYAASQSELLERRRAEEELHDTVARLQRSESELSRTHEEMIRRLAHAAEFRSAETGLHVDRMSRYCALLAERLQLEEARCELVRIASPLHDVGKIAIPDSILLKPGPLTPAERKVMEQHAEIGYSLLSGSSSELFEVAASIALTHHERYDGRGYPRGLAGTEIPLEGRIATVGDVFDALTSVRVYRPALSVEEALEVMRSGRGTQFDPFVLDLFLESLDALDVPLFRLADARRSQARSADMSPPPERPVRELSPELLADACRTALSALAEIDDDRRAIDEAFRRLREVGGSELLPSVYLLEHDRLWLIAQRGYDEVRDGFSIDQGVLARAVRTGEPQFVADVHADPDYVPAMDIVRSEITIPFGAVAEGAFNVESSFSALPLEALAIFSELATALEPRIGAIGSDLTFDLARLARLCVFASSLRGVGAIAEFAARTLGRLLDLECAQINLTASDGRRLASFWRLPDSELKPLAPSDVEQVAELATIGQATFGVIETNRAGLVDDGGPKWLVWLPLQSAGSDIGALIGRAAVPPVLEREQAEGATLFAQHIAALIDVAWALRREQRAAVTDPLTGLLNRRGFDDRLADEIDRARRSEKPLAVVLMDCDDLKEINDRGGHEHGDAALRLVADCLRVNKRSSDVAARVGGDEFVLLLPETDRFAACEAVERLRGLVRDAGLAAGIPVTATCGIACFPVDGSESGSVVRAADAALYDAKHGPRLGSVAHAGGI